MLVAQSVLLTVVIQGPQKGVQSMWRDSLFGLRRFALAMNVWSAGPSLADLLFHWIWRQNLASVLAKPSWLPKVACWYGCKPKVYVGHRKHARGNCESRGGSLDAFKKAGWPRNRALDLLLAKQVENAGRWRPLSWLYVAGGPGVWGMSLIWMICWIIVLNFQRFSRLKIYEECDVLIPYLVEASQWETVDFMIRKSYRYFQVLGPSQP